MDAAGPVCAYALYSHKDLVALGRYLVCEIAVDLREGLALAVNPQHRPWYACTAIVYSTPHDLPSKVAEFRALVKDDYMLVGEVGIGAYMIDNNAGAPAQAAGGGMGIGIGMGMGVEDADVELADADADADAMSEDLFVQLHGTDADG